MIVGNHLRCKHDFLMQTVVCSNTQTAELFPDNSGQTTAEKKLNPRFYQMVKMKTHK